MNLLRFCLIKQYLVCFVVLSINTTLKWKNREIGLKSLNVRQIVTDAVEWQN